MPEKKTILVAPLHWGLGHATRCIPIIRALLRQEFNVLIASDGCALLLLQKEFPQLEAIELPSYDIKYSKNRYFFKWKILLQIPKVKKAITAENKIVARLVSENRIQGIISDNRFGVRNLKVASVIITHQLNVLTGSTSFLSSYIHQKIIKRFDCCWVPDLAHSKVNLSGKLGHLKKGVFPIKYIGPLSRMKKLTISKTIDILILISGPEPQRTALEEMLKPLFKNTKLNVLMIRGVLEDMENKKNYGTLKIVNYMTSVELEETINKSKIVICRSGYSTIMDLSTLEKKAFFIPTPGQNEQEYLANRLSKLQIAPSCKQEDFNLDKLDDIEDYTGLKTLDTEAFDYSELFSLFKSEREF